MGSTECPDCGTEHQPEMGIVVGTPQGGGRRCCTLCLARELRTQTILSDREAEVAAHQELTDAEPATIAERIGLSTGAVEEHGRQIEMKLEVTERVARRSQEP